MQEYVHESDLKQERKRGRLNIMKKAFTCMMHVALCACSGVFGETSPQKTLPPVIADFEVRSNPALSGKCAVFYIDDVIWLFRDLARQRPQRLFDNPFLKVLKDAHDKYGMKVQLNCFYRTDFFYGTDELTLAETPDRYKDEWQANKDWLRLGFHSLQEFPDYPFMGFRGSGTIGGLRVVE